MVGEVEVIAADCTTDDYLTFMEMHQTCIYTDVIELEDEELERELSQRQPLIKNYNYYTSYVEDGRIVFVSLDKQKVGYAILGFITVVSGSIMRIDEFFIKKEVRRRGIGKIAVSKLCNQARKMDIDVVTLFSFSAATDMFWSSCGFSVIETGMYEKVLN